MRYIILALLFLAQAYASSYEECFFEAEIIKEDKLEYEVNIKKIIKEEGHIMNCARFIGSRKIPLKNPKDLKDKKSFKLRYWTYSGMGPNGPVGSTTWEVLKKDQSSNK